jgi:hypothetical protein
LDMLNGSGKINSTMAVVHVIMTLILWVSHDNNYHCEA